MSKNRNYNYSDVDMALASKTIARSFKTNLSELSTVRTNWTPEYGNELEVKIDNAINKYLGIDAKKELRDASNKLSEVMGPAKRNLSFFKTQVEEDFKDDKNKQNEYLSIFGFNKNLKAVQNDNQEALIRLLFSFKTNMTDSLKQEITSKGMNPVLIDNIIGYADTVMAANVLQEGLKETTKEISGDVVTVFNGIYDEVISICKIASNYYQYEPLKKEQFTFSKVVANMKAGN